MCSILPLKPDGSLDYWNGDGHGVGEVGNSGVTCLRCASYFNSDGGFDSKALAQTYGACVSCGNPKNDRAWRDATFNDSGSNEPMSWGGAGGTDIYHYGFYSIDDVDMTMTLNRPIFYATTTAPLFHVEFAHQTTIVIDSPFANVPPGTKLFEKASGAPDPIFVWKNGQFNLPMR